MSDVVEELKQLSEVYIPADPTEDGFGKISQAICDVQKSLVRTTQIALDAYENVRGKKRKRAALKARLEIKKADLSNTDKDVKAGKSQSVRDALIMDKIKEDYIELEKADMNVVDAEAILKQAEYVLSCLKHTKELTSRQLDTVQKEIDLGLITPETVRNAN